MVYKQTETASPVVVINRVRSNREMPNMIFDITAIQKGDKTNITACTIIQLAPNRKPNYALSSELISN